MDDRFNTAAGWVLFSGIVALGLTSISSRIYHADSSEAPEVAGYPVEGAVEAGGVEAGPDLGTLLAASDPAAGEKIFAKCTACHTINSGGANGIGPNLYGVIGEGVGVGAGGYAFSSALSGHGGTWTYENMDAWLKSPKAFASGTKMSFAGLGKPEDRANMLAYLKANGGGPDFPAPAAPVAAEGEEGVDALGEGPGAVEGANPDAVEAAGAMGAEQPVPSN